MEEEAVQRVGLYQAESRHGAWRDSVVPMHVARLSLATSAAWPRGVPAWQLGRAKAYGATLQEVTPRNLARPKELVFKNLNLHGLLLKY